MGIQLTKAALYNSSNLVVEHLVSDQHLEDLTDSTIAAYLSQLQLPLPPGFALSGQIEIEMSPVRYSIDHAVAVVAAAVHDALKVVDTAVLDLGWYQQSVVDEAIDSMP